MLSGIYNLHIKYISLVGMIIFCICLGSSKFIFKMDSAETGTCAGRNVQRFLQRAIKTSRYK